MESDKPLKVAVLGCGSVGSQVVRLLEEQAGDLDLTRRVEPAYGDAGQLDRCTDAGLEVAGLLTEQPHHLGADRATAQHGHLERLVALLHS